MKKLIVLLLLLFSLNAKSQNLKVAILISANAEWKIVKEVYPNEKYESSPWGEYFYKSLKGIPHEVLFFHEGWGKVAASGATQYVIDHFQPEYLINIGTCGGFAGSIKRFDLILVNRTVIYDIMEAMGDSKQAIQDYSTSMDLSWLSENMPSTVIKTILVSGDRDIIAAEIPKLKLEYSAIAADWESGAIAYTTARNKKKILILRGVTDLVHEKKGGEAYGNESVFVEGTRIVMKRLLDELPEWVKMCR